MISLIFCAKVKLLVVGYFNPSVLGLGVEGPMIRTFKNSEKFASGGESIKQTIYEFQYMSTPSGNLLSGRKGGKVGPPPRFLILLFLFMLLWPFWHSKDSSPHRAFMKPERVMGSMEWGWA